jgi:hypothetical protein
MSEWGVLTVLALLKQHPMPYFVLLPSRLLSWDIHLGKKYDEEGLECGSSGRPPAKQA